MSSSVINIERKQRLPHASEIDIVVVMRSFYQVVDLYGLVDMAADCTLKFKSRFDIC